MEHQILTAANQHTIYFKSFIQQLVDKFNPLKIYCFGRQTNYKSEQGFFSANACRIMVNYHLLFVTDSNTRIDHEVQDYVNNIYEDGHITALCHGREAISEAISKNSRFFINITSRCELVYETTGIHLQEVFPVYDNTNAAHKAHDHFQHRTLLAEAFLDCAKECLTRKQFRIGAFLLHQAVEQGCIGLIRVNLSYRSEFHNLKRLLHLSTAFSGKPFEHFFTGADHDERLFEILIKSYSQARYNKAFEIEEYDANLLYAKVRTFIGLVNELCEEQIMRLEKEVLDA